jgi:hypothetical protein
MHPLSVWAITAQSDLKETTALAALHHQNYTFKLFNTGDSLWLLACWPEQHNQVALRLAFSASDALVVKKLKEKDDGIELTLETLSATYITIINFPDPERPLVHYTTCLKPRSALLIPYWPKDILPMTKNGDISQQGEVHIQQIGTRTGQLFFSFNSNPAASVFYYQNLTALGPYCEATKTSAGELVGGKWPELGFSLPPAIEEPLPQGETFTISDAYVLLSDAAPENKNQAATRFMEHLATVYLQLPRPEPVYYNWVETAKRSIADLAGHKGCWTYGGGNAYLNAYVSDYKTPPEVMVQLAVLIPVLEYCRWDGCEHPVLFQLKEGLPSFYDKELKTLVRWLPALEGNLDESEEQKQKRVMDSWYLHHPLMNLCRLAGTGDKEAKQLLLDCIDYAIKVAHHFDYQWPVFYKMDTLEVIKAETKTGEGGEKDVPGAYAHLMLEVWKLTGEQRYFNEAKKAAEKLKGMGVEIFYQANNTSFAAKAMLRLYKETKDPQYLDISYACLASIFKNVQLWDCDYGYGKYFPTFFAIFPLNDAPYTAAYEEQEVYSGLTQYLIEAEGVELPPNLRMLMAEFIRYTVTRIQYYYPPLLPPEMMNQDVKTGEVDPELWIPLEDIHDGWEQSGEVGQEVYGAGIAFGIVPRQYYKVPGEDFMIYIDYPVPEFKGKGKSVSFKILGDGRLNCRMRVITTGKKKLPEITVSIKGQNTPASAKRAEKGAFDYSLPGNAEVQVKWKAVSIDKADATKRKRRQPAAK